MLWFKFFLRRILTYTFSSCAPGFLSFSLTGDPGNTRRLHQAQVRLTCKQRGPFSDLSYFLIRALLQQAALTEFSPDLLL